MPAADSGVALLLGKIHEIGPAHTGIFLIVAGLLRVLENETFGQIEAEGLLIGSDCPRVKPKAR